MSYKWSVSIFFGPQFETYALVKMADESQALQATGKCYAIQALVEVGTKR